MNNSERTGKNISSPTSSPIIDDTSNKDENDTLINNERYTSEEAIDSNEVRSMENYTVTNVDNKPPQDFDSFMGYLDKEIQGNVYSFKKHSNRHESYRTTWMLNVANFLINCLIPQGEFSFPSNPHGGAVIAGLILALVVAALWLVAAIVLPIIAGVFALGHIITKGIAQKVSNDQMQQNLINMEIYSFLKNKLTDILPNQDGIDYKELYTVLELTLKKQDSHSKQQISSLSAKFDDVFESYTNIAEITKKIENLDTYDYSGEEIEKMERAIADIKNHNKSIKTLPLEITTEEYRKTINPEEEYNTSTSNEIQKLQENISQCETKIQNILQSPFKEQNEEYKPTVKQLKNMKKEIKVLFSKLKDEDQQLIKSYQLRIKNAKKRTNYQQQSEIMHETHRSADTFFKKAFNDIFEILEGNIENEKNQQIINDVKKSLFSNKEDNKKFISDIIQVFSGKYDEQVDDVSIDKYKMYDNYADAIASDLQRASQTNNLPHTE
jgi:hypothetical protein